MERVNVYADGAFVGWFDYDAGRRWSDRDPVTGKGSRGDGRGEAVILTAGGKWVLEEWTNWSGEEYRHRYISADEAQRWLLAAGHDTAVKELWGAPPPEVSYGAPVTVGGSRRVIQAPDGVWEAVDASAAELGVSGAEVVRRAIRTYLGLDDIAKLN